MVGITSGGAGVNDHMAGSRSGPGVMTPGSRSAAVGVTSPGVHFADETLAGVPGLLGDLALLQQETDTSDVVFIVGPEQKQCHAHRLILWAR